MGAVYQVVGLLLALGGLASRPDDSFCYDDCSGHGACVNNVCQCDQGWFGENCATSYGMSPLSVGHMNITSVEALNRLLREHEFVCLGISSVKCAKCASIEEEYAQVHFGKVPFARIDAIVYPELMFALGVDATIVLPVLQFAWNYGKKKAVYRGSQGANAIQDFLSIKSASPAYESWNSLTTRPFAPSSPEFLVVAFVNSLSQDDDYGIEELEQVASDLRGRYDIAIYAIQARSTDLPKPRLFWHPPKSTRLPAIGIGSSQSEEGWKFISLSEQLPHGVSVASWIQLQAIPLAVEMTPYTFSTTEQAGLPMLLLFAPNMSELSPLLPKFRETALEFRDKISFMYDATGNYAEQMRVLGLDDPTKVSMAMNTRDSGPVPFREHTVTGPSFKRFCAEFLSGKASPLLAASVSSSTSDDDHDEDVAGVSEGFYASDVGIVDATHYWSRVAMDETKDVVVFVYRARQCPRCKQLAPIFKKMARRFHALAQDSTRHSVVCARIDLDQVTPFSLQDTIVPAIVLLPADAKHPPHRFFTAVAKVYTIMEWVRENSATSFAWGEDLPQFDQHEKSLFRHQIKQRELKRANQEL